MPRKKTTTKAKTTAKTPRKRTATKKITMLQPKSENYSEKIRERAYELFIEKGGYNGSDVTDWLEAEKQVKDEYSMV